MVNNLGSGLPALKGSPFRTKNFMKFFFGIMIAALVFGAIIFAFFYHVHSKHAVSPSDPGRGFHSASKADPTA